MTIIEVISSGRGLNLRQQWAHILTMALGFVMLALGMNIRSGVISAVVPYSNVQAGITAFYPERWLLDRGQDYVFRVRDMTESGFKTTIQVSTRPISGDTSERNVLDSLSLSRSQTFTDYSVLAVEPFSFQDGVEAQAMFYTYVSRQASPFLEGVPAVVLGLDILTLSRGQAIIITYRADANVYDANRHYFDRFLSTLEF